MYAQAEPSSKWNDNNDKKSNISNLNLKISFIAENVVYIGIRRTLKFIYTIRTYTVCTSFYKLYVHMCVSVVCMLCVHIHPYDTNTRMTRV